MPVCDPEVREQFIRSVAGRKQRRASDQHVLRPLVPCSPSVCASTQQHLHRLRRQTAICREDREVVLLERNSSSKTQPQKNSASKPSYPLVSYSPLSQVNEPTPTQYDDPEDAFVEAVASETNLIPRRVNRTSGPRSSSSKASEWKRFTTERILSAKKKGLFPIDESSQNNIADGILDGKRKEVKSVGSASTGSSGESTIIGPSKWKTPGVETWKHDAQFKNKSVGWNYYSNNLFIYLFYSFVKSMFTANATLINKVQLMAVCVCEITSIGTF